MIATAAVRERGIGCGSVLRLYRVKRYRHLRVSDDSRGGVSLQRLGLEGDVEALDRGRVTRRHIALGGSERWGVW